MVNNLQGDSLLFKELDRMQLDLSPEIQIELLHELKIPDYITSNIKYELFEWQENALKNLLRYDWFKKRSNPNVPSHLMFNMATGSGKTLIMASAILYYYVQGYRHFLFFVDQTNIVGKTQSNFIDKTHSKYLFKEKIIIEGQEIEINEVDVFNPDTNEIEIKFVTTAKLHNDIHIEKENNVTLDQLHKLDIVMIADEAHHLSADTKRDDMDEWEQLEILELELDGRAGKNQIERRGWEYTAVHLILNKNNNFSKNKNIMLEFTATIDMNQKVFDKYRNKLVYKFDLKEFLQKGYTKEINLISSNLNKKSRIIQALLFSWYREEIAFKYYEKGITDLVNFKPVILFRSKDIEESKHDYNEFLNIIDTIEEGDLEFLDNIYSYMNSSSSLNEQGLSKTIELIEYIKTNNITYNEIINDFRIRFNKENCIITNSEDNRTKTEKTTEEQEELLNNLEDHSNTIRAIFTVKRLTEGWDVLNLYDIVRLYQGQNSGGSTKSTPAATTQEKQLIGRGVRYYPFGFKEFEKNKRKFDNDISNELRILEELNYYTYDEESRYISHLKEELRKDGYISDGKIVQQFGIKESFKNTSYFQDNKLWVNYRKPNKERVKTNLEEIDEDFYLGYRLDSLELREMVFEIDEKDEIDRLEIAARNGFSKTFKLTDFDTNIVQKSISILGRKKSSIFRFNNLHEILKISSINDIYDTNYLGKFNIKIISSEKIESPNNLNRKIQLDIIEDFLLAFQSEITRFINPYVGTSFEAVAFEDIFGEPKIKSVQESDYSQQQELRNILANEDWYVVDNFVGTDQERKLIQEIRSTIENLFEKYEEVFLLRNEELYKVFDFNHGRGFQPDFLLLLKGKADDNKFYQIFVEPKGEHLLEREKWKQDFLEEIGKRYGEGDILSHHNNNYSLIGLPLYNSNNKLEFEEAYRKIWGND